MILTGSASDLPWGSQMSIYFHRLDRTLGIPSARDRTFSPAPSSVRCKRKMGYRFLLVRIIQDKPTSYRGAIPYSMVNVRSK
jgi:hypothetical protein